MENVNLALTNSLTKIHKQLSIYKDVLEEGKDTYDDIKSVKSDDEHLSSKVRTKANAYQKKFTKKKYDEIKYDHDLLLEDFSLINRHKNEESVIYNIAKFSEYYEALKKLHKKYEFFIDDLESDEKEYLFDENYVMTSNTHKILAVVKRYDSFIESEKSKIEVFYLKKKREE